MPLNHQLTKRQEKLLDDLIDAQSIKPPTKAVWKMQIIIKEFEKDIRQKVMTDINSLQDCCHKGDHIPGFKSTHDIFNIVVKEP